MKASPSLFTALILAVLGASTLVAGAPPAIAAEAAATESQEGWYTQLVDFEFMKQQVEIPPKPGVMIIDARPAPRKYDPGHIPGAINIPDTNFDAMVSKLSEDKSTLLIFYCEGVKCILSHKSAFKAEKLGYTNVKVYPGGFPEWAEKGMTVAVSAAYIKKLIDEKGKYVLIDARPERMFSKGSIPTAINIPDTHFDKHLDKLPADKTTQLIFFCGGLKCVLSDKSAEKARKLGYTSIVTYPEGYPEWEQLYGAPTGAAPGAAAPGAAAPTDASAAKPAAPTIEPGKEKGSISLASFERIMKEDPNALLIVDVRDEKDFKKTPIKGSINIPIDHLEKKMNTLPTGKPLIFLCGTGARAGEAYDMVKLLRSDLQPYFLDAEVTFHADGTYSLKPLK